MNIKKIEIWWQGPFTLEQAKEYNSQHSDFGIYQVYGTHNIFGANSLLYIGKADNQTFAQRLGQHHWMKWEPSSIEIYLGNIGSIEKKHTKQTVLWSEEINIAEKLLIYYCAPPYNSKNIQSYGDAKGKNAIVFNFDKKHRLPLEVSTFYDESDFWNDENWNVYGGSDGKFNKQDQ